MNSIVLNDLEMNRDLDREAMLDVKGGFTCTQTGSVKQCTMTVFGKYTYQYTWVEGYRGRIVLL